MPRDVAVGTFAELREHGTLITKLGSQPVCVFYRDGEAFAVDDRCPHLGFPLHRGHVENGLLTCHWHHARFDLASGGTLDPFADNVRAYAVEIRNDEVILVVNDPVEDPEPSLRRLEEGLEQGLTLVMAKALLSLVDLLGISEATVAALRRAVAFGTRYRRDGWGPGLTVLTAMANVLPVLNPDDRVLALVHGLAFVARDAGGAPRFALTPLERSPDGERLLAWYRRFVDTRNGDAAERILATACASGEPISDLVQLTAAAVTDHVFIDGGHTVDFLNKAFEMINHLGGADAAVVLPALARQTASASRSEESGSWRHPLDLADLVTRALAARPTLVADPGRFADEDVDSLAWAILGEDAVEILEALNRSLARGAAPEQLARAVAYAAALRMSRFHTQNDHGDWDVVHHAFTAANALHQLIRQAPSDELLRGVYQLAMKIYLDRFLNVPAARLPSGTGSDDLDDLARCWNEEGKVDEAGGIVYAFLRGGGDRHVLISALGTGLLTEDAEFHWFQTFEAAVRQCAAWPLDSEQSALILVGAARFLAAHTPTRRELSQVVRIAARLRRGEALYEIA